jgi:hypothetical protein
MRNGRFCIFPARRARKGLASIRSRKLLILVKGAGTYTPGLLLVKQSVKRHDRTGGAIADSFERHLIKLVRHGCGTKKINDLEA